MKRELEKRGLKPIADHHADYRVSASRIPNGFDVAVTNGTKANRRKAPRPHKTTAPAPFEPTGWNTLYLDHISLEVPDFRRSAATPVAPRLAGAAGNRHAGSPSRSATLAARSCAAMRHAGAAARETPAVPSRHR